MENELENKNISTTLTDKDSLYADMSELVAIDMANTSKQEIVDQLKEQSSTVGFFLIKNVAGYDEQAYFDAVKKFYAMPYELKKKMLPSFKNPDNNNHYLGFKPFEDNDKSHKEFYEEQIPLSGHTKAEVENYPLYEFQAFDPENIDFKEAKEVRRVFDKHHESMLNIGIQLIRYTALSLGKEENYFDEWFINGSLTTFRNIHY